MNLAFSHPTSNFRSNKSVWREIDLTDILSSAFYVLHLCSVFQAETMGILGLAKLLQDVVPHAIKESEIKHYFGEKNL